MIAKENKGYKTVVKNVIYIISNYTTTILKMGIEDTNILFKYYFTRINIALILTSNILNPKDDFKNNQISQNYKKIKENLIPNGHGWKFFLL
jgi:hypothetical protein